VSGQGGAGGVYGATTNGYGVNGLSTNGTGVYGSGSPGVQGSSSGHAVEGDASGANSIGVYGTCTGTGCAALYSNGAFTLNGNGVYSGTWVHSSDERMKKDITTLKGAIDRLLQLRGVSYYWKEPSKHGDSVGLQRGFVAQEYERVFPEWVTTDRDGFKAINTTDLDALEVESIRTLKMQNDFLAEQVKELQSGRRPIVSGIDLNGVGFGIGGLAIGVGLYFGLVRRKRFEEQPRTIA
jgi:hypothetical protein